MLSEIDIRDWGKCPTKLIESKEQYEHYLKHFDWNYDFIDDFSVWNRWRKAMNCLVIAADQFDPEKIIWKRYAPNT